ncbi:hypothetical protein NM208_g16435 [Fusarium decemcellulare]|uniref:Uncharacterized protein n=1 Tax=Fusarium decemcellulare TaxID=57161 RepID=A0ACC1RBF0_9HYPO|nr:hypothetical protein NM208_g16435 [Fusarium decemcellulare]
MIMMTSPVKVGESTSHYHSSLAEVNLGKRHHLGSADDLVSDIRRKEQHQADIVGEEVARVPLDEDGEAARDGYECDEERAIVGQVGLHRGEVGQFGAADALDVHHFLEPNVADVDEDPGDEARRGADVEQPVEDSLTTGGELMKPKRPRAEQAATAK